MNRNQFIAYLKHPENLDGLSLSSMENIVEEFPYFNTAHLLLAKNLHNENSIHYHSQLKLAAAYAGNRQLLYKLIKKQPAEILVEEAGEEQSKPVFTLEKQSEVIEIPKSDEVILELLGVKEQPQFIELKEEKTKIIEETPVYPQVEGLEEVEKIQSDKTKLAKDEIISAINASMEKEAGDEKLDEPMIIKEPVKKPSLDKTAKYSFSEWLKAAGTKNLSEEHKDEKQKSISELIDKFIEEEPRISKPKAEFFSPVDKARKSISDSDEFVSETLAKIYAQQGNYLKAIRCYEKLSLLHPEKSAFFAARIKELKRNINSK